MRQLALPFAPHRSLAAADLLRDSSNAAALAWLAAPAGWPLGRLALFGPEGVGKTHMLHVTAAAQGWMVLSGAELRGLPPQPSTGLALDDADMVPDQLAFLHLVNLCAEARLPLLMAGRSPPSRWPLTLADLTSRLRATTAVEISPPSDALLQALLQKHFADRQLRTSPAFVAWLLARLPREAQAVAEAAARLDRASLADGGRITRPLALACLGPLLAPEDDYVTERASASPATGTLL